jgi:murein DD-endopeptidase MepM/ murein hydrolase activator NlpD
MTWPILGSIFALSVIIVLLLLIMIFAKPAIWVKNKSKISTFYIIWFLSYSIFVIFFTGPQDIHIYPAQATSPYRLPWKSGINRLVVQGNRSFTSHRDLHRYAWDFLMENGTQILASRSGVAIEIRDDFDGIGLDSNFVILEHEDGQRSGYFHIQYKSSLIRLGDFVKQGQPIALSGMVGQTIFPHVHFAVLNKEASASLPISFNDVPGGIPLAGHFYVSGNQGDLNQTKSP